MLFLNFLYILIMIIFMFRITEFCGINMFNPKIRFINIFSKPSRFIGFFASCVLILWCRTLFLYPVKYELLHNIMPQIFWAKTAGVIGIIGLFSTLQNKWHNFKICSLISFCTALVITVIAAVFSINNISGVPPIFHYLFFVGLIFL